MTEKQFEEQRIKYVNTLVKRHGVDKTRHIANAAYYKGLNIFPSYYECADKGNLEETYNKLLTLNKED